MTLDTQPRGQWRSLWYNLNAPIYISGYTSRSYLYYEREAVLLR